MGRWEGERYERGDWGRERRGGRWREERRERNEKVRQETGENV